MGRTSASADQIVSSSSSTITVTGTNTKYTDHFTLGHGAAFALIYQFTSDDAVNVKIDLEQSENVPVNANASDGTYVIPEGASAIDTVTDENKHLKTLSPLPIKYGRLKLTGLSGNDASTTLNAKISKVEDI